MTRLRAAIAVCAFALVATGVADEAAETGSDIATTAAIEAGRAEYKIRMSGISGRLETVVSVDEGTVSATHAVRATGFASLFAGGKIVETTRFRVAEDRVVPLSYESEDTLSRDKGQLSLQFDTTEGTVIGALSPRGETPIAIDTVYTPGLLDRVAIQYQLMLDLQSGETATDPGEAGGDSDTPASRYTLFDPEQSKDIDITLIGTRDIRANGETHTAVGVRHQSPGSSRRTELWCAPALGYLPVLIEQYRKDKLRVRATLESYAPSN